MIRDAMLGAATYLGDNTVPVLDDIVAGLRAAGFEIAVDATAGRDSTDAARHAAGVDLVWMCGSLASVMLAAGRLDHEVVAAPVFPGEANALYRSVFVARGDGPGSLDEALDATIGINEPESWSGNHGLRRFAATRLGTRWFTSEAPTGSHRGSLSAVATGMCDVAGIDSSIWNAMAAAGDPVLEGLRVIGTADDWPAPPILIGRNAPPGLAAALLGLRPDGLVRLVPAAAEDYAFMQV